jgi:hypothetical protein
MERVKIFYGMSGALKSSTIDSIDEKMNYSMPIMRSSIKVWKKYQTGISVFREQTIPNDLNFGILHLIKLEEFLEDNVYYEKAIIERGITDHLFYHISKGNDILEEQIKEVVNEELELFNRDCIEVEKILLVQEDRDFVRDVVLSNKYRSSCFSDVDDYMRQQDLYVKFTQEHNDIFEVIKIKNAKDYIENNLGMEFKN